MRAPAGRARRGPSTSLRAGPSARLRTGYTLIEVLTVVAILGILTSIILYGMAQYRRRAYQEGSKAVLQSVRAALDAYYRDFAQYPPDGYDQVVKRTINNQQHVIRGGQCLLYFLGTPMVVTREVGQQTRLEQKKPYLDLSADMVSGEYDEDLDERINDPKAEIVDKYGNALHYDNCERDESGTVRSLEQADSHVEGGEGMVQAPDPRKPRGGAGGGPSGGGAGFQPRNKGAYDLWSHGFKISDPSDDITNWR